MFKYLTGVKPSGNFHLGNFISTILPIMNEGIQDETLFLIADYHALTNPSHLSKISEDRWNIAKILYSFGIKNILFQSSIPQIFELNWILSNFTPKGLLNRAHGYKAQVDINNSRGKPVDYGINTGLFNYPVLMTSDLTIFSTDYVFVGEDQKQHIEIAKDIIDNFNRLNYQLKVPDPIFKSDKLVLGTDGRKMSKSYKNEIPVMTSKKKLKKYIFSLPTNEKNVGESKGFDESHVCELFKSFASQSDVRGLKEQMVNGIGWGEVKQTVFDEILEWFEHPWEVYYNIDSQDLKRYVNSTTEKARGIAENVLLNVRSSMNV